MYIEGYGSIVIELYPEIAPNTVNNFISLVKSGFYAVSYTHLGYWRDWEYEHHEKCVKEQAGAANATPAYP